MDKKQEILEATFELFCEKGYHLSMAELAQKVDIKTPSLYSHFNSKDQILSIVIYEEIQRFYDNLYKRMIIAEKLDCKEALKSVFNFIMVYFSENRRLHFWRRLPFIDNEQLRTTSSNLIAEKDKEFNQIMKSCFHKGKESGEIRNNIAYSSLQLYFCTIQGVLDGMLLYGTSHEKTYSDNIFEAYWLGICGVTEDKEESI